MREKIAELITRTHRTDSSWLYMGDAVDQILTLITEEIEKVENPYIGGYTNVGFEYCRTKILSLFKEEK